MEDGCGEKCNWKFLGNRVDNNSNRVDNKIENLVANVFKQNFATDLMTIVYLWTPRYPGTEVDGFDAFAEILFEIKIDVGNRVDILVTGLTNYKIITCSCADLIYKWHFFT